MQDFGHIALARGHLALRSGPSSPRTPPAWPTHPAPATARPGHSAHSVWQAKPSALTAAARPGFQRAPDRSRFGLGGASPFGEAPNISFKPNPDRHCVQMYGRMGFLSVPIHAFRVGLIPALGSLCNHFVRASLQRPASQASAAHVQSRASATSRWRVGTLALRSGPFTPRTPLAWPNTPPRRPLAPATAPRALAGQAAGSHHRGTAGLPTGSRSQ